MKKKVEEAINVILHESLFKVLITQIIIVDVTNHEVAIYDVEATIPEEILELEVEKAYIAYCCSHLSDVTENISKIYIEV